ncbi:MAG: FHA domain-containing protein, partial [Candidatus Binatia bacterium]
IPPAKPPAPPEPAPPPPPPPPAPRIVLRVLSGPDQGKSFEPPPGAVRFTVGRGEKADWRLSDPGISSLHFSVVAADGGFELRDDGSRNGTFVDGKPERVTALRLRGGEAVRIGATELRVEVIGAPPAAEGTVVMAAPKAPPAPETKPPEAPAPAKEAPKPPAAAAKPKEPPAGAPPPKKKPEEAVPELARSAEAKERISRIMKGVSLRPVRMPGTARQWASLGLVLLAVLVSWGLPRSWVSAGPVHEGHAGIEGQCETCHVSGPTISFLSIGGAFVEPLRMDASCVTADCHASVLRNQADVRDDCVSCHTEHRGRKFEISGGEQLCWSCHVGNESPQDFQTRLMQVAVTRDEGLRARLADRVGR